MDSQQQSRFEVQDIRIANLERDIAFYAKAALVLVKAHRASVARTLRNRSRMTDADFWMAIQNEFSLNRKLTHVGSQRATAIEALRVARAERGY